MSIVIKPTPTPVPIPLQTQIWSFIMVNFALIVTLILIAVVFAAIYIILRSIKNRKGKKALLFNDFNVGKFKIIFFRMIGGKYHEIDRKKIQINQCEPTKFRFNNKAFTTFDIEKIGFSDKKYNYYCFDYDTQAQLVFNERNMPENIEGSFVDTIINRGIIEQLVKGLEDLKPKGQWLYIAIGLILGLAIGLIIGILIAPYLTHTVTTSTPITTPTPTFHPFISGILEKIGVS
jgi:hypothetical protein